MNIKSLTLKNTIVDEKTGESYYDMSAPSFRYVSDYGIKAVHYVTNNQAGRIDLIADLYFGNGEYIDAICIVNNIFNPFSVNEGDVLVIPNLSKPDLFYKKPKTTNIPNFIQSEYTDNRQSEKDKSRIERLSNKAKNKKSGVKNPLPPNVLQPGQDAKLYSDGNITLGSNLNTRSDL